MIEGGLERAGGPVRISHCTTKAGDRSTGSDSIRMILARPTALPACNWRMPVVLMRLSVKWLSTASAATWLGSSPRHPPFDPFVVTSQFGRLPKSSFAWFVGPVPRKRKFLYIRSTIDLGLSICQRQWKTLFGASLRKSFEAYLAACPCAHHRRRELLA